MVINIAIHKTFIIHNLVNESFVARMSSTKKHILNVLIFVRAYSNKNNFMLIKSKKYGIIIVIIRILIESKKLFIIISVYTL